MKTWLTWSRRSLSALVTVGVAIDLSILLARAEEFQPPDRGTPGRLEGAGTRLLEPGDFQPPDETLLDVTRGACDLDLEETSTPLTPLVPENDFGITLQGYPTFFVYVPELPDTAAIEFVVTEWEFNETESGTDVSDRDLYATTVDAPEEAGILALTLPSQDEAGNTIEPLRVEGNYTWFVRVICDAERPTRYGPDIWVEAWVKRLNPSDRFAATLASATSLQRQELYAETGVWYDALATLAELRRDDPTPAVDAAWRELLESVGLNEVADESLSGDR
ncbi:Membrane protein related to metalloendopeptidase [Geitlerinema sp. FC II]|nr:Membrane protein related to metalloendopeptidase [Geitlerinema sp. FC II]